MTEGKKTRTIYVDEDAHNGMVKLAKEDSRSFNSYVNLLFKNHVKENKKPSLVKREKAA